MIHIIIILVICIFVVRFLQKKLHIRNRKILRWIVRRITALFIR